MRRNICVFPGDADGNDNNCEDGDEDAMKRSSFDGGGDEEDGGDINSKEECS